MIERKILVVDDEESIRDAMQLAFQKAGYMVQCVKSAEVAQEVLKKENFQVLFLDLNLPGMSGIDLCKEIKQEKPISIIHAVTGYATVFELSDCRQAGFDDYLPKPVSLKSLFKAAEDAFEKLQRWEMQ